MIYGNLTNRESFKYLPEAILKVFDYALKNDIENFKPGNYEIDSDKIFVNVVQYDTKDIKDRFWEAHKKYLDIHVVFKGNERININFIDNLKKLEYVDKDDFLPLEGEFKSSLVLNKNDFLICYPEDAHMTALKVNESENVKKAIFKISLDIL
ncbi:YhcH/YjgK/YiaL family protein [Clostridium botulinum]|uniref:YhcH/YjgK/YiaL family protein n=1 Tax=Clostridium botulinum C/D str. DC5 TaxID=1443128 RepID=A0A0A0IH25_CLOBO|nr:YhcH/YjgK/YiaL family protein [Clostridium botulinum]KEI07516.1 YhcH/YjgK/YiaL family protein [Clostridium botulinum C/D str. BKT75002]KEI09884.1 YhcH/YjgK/YiaL family protein [Clostridium botulinum C/D str. BKT2873]KGN00730.1 YhcH/YjgK/YiaL family protein [Clostridium botulinum C/D str. DC5]KOC53122.1 YhcH/YjgK/YiaL family protein [Clostridium botulinum]KOC58487.1 YhcH/YjgK/YiaL family protein [Clostridium botulinum]